MFESLRNKHSKIEWSKIARTRDKLIHSYFGVDEEVIWDMVKRDIPRLFEELKDIVESENWNLDIDF